MHDHANAASDSRRSLVDVVTLAFGVTVAMWAIGYVGRLPSVMAPAAVLLALFLACLLAGGVIAARATGRGVAGGAWVGLLSGLLNLLVLGSLLAGERPNQVVPATALWVPGFLAASAVLGAIGAAVSSSAGPARRVAPTAWIGAFSKVAVGATLLLLAIGGLVTTHEAGLAVVDWPNSYGYNMFLFPLSRMTGGIYYEHAHRLFGALVGLTTLSLAIAIHRLDPRPRVRALGWIAFALVVVQGLLGGLRVTGRFTLSASPADVDPNIALAVVHGILGQVFLATLVVLAVVTSRSWLAAPAPLARASARTDRVLCATLVALLLAQITLGAVQRHLASGLLNHITLAAVVLLVALTCGVRAWGLNPETRTLRFLGHGLVDVTIFQVVLGVAALAATGPLGPGGRQSVFQVTAATLHQWCGAVLLGLAVMLLAWTWRLLEPAGTADASRVPGAQGLGKPSWR